MAELEQYIDGMINVGWDATKDRHIIIIGHIHAVQYCLCETHSGLPQLQNIQIDSLQAKF